MTTADVDTTGDGGKRPAFARVASLLELPKERQRNNEGWEEEIRVAFRMSLAEKTEPHRISTILPLLPPKVALTELRAAWSDLSPETRARIVTDFRQKVSLLPLSVGLARELASNGAAPNAAESARAALQALRRHATKDMCKWIEGGGLEDLAALLPSLRDWLPDFADHMNTLIAAAENGLQITSKPTVRARVASFAQSALQLVESAGLEEDQVGVLSNRLSTLGVGVEQVSVTKGGKGVKKGSEQGGREAATPSPAGGRSSIGPSPTKSQGSGPTDLTSPRALAVALGQIVSLLEELEVRRGEAALLEQVREEKLGVENQLAEVRESLVNETHIVESLRIRVAELEKHVESLKRKSEAGERHSSDLERGLADAKSRLGELAEERTRLLDELPQQRLAESRARIRSRIKPILDELDEFRSHSGLAHETLAFLDRYRSLREILLEEKLVDA